MRFMSYLLIPYTVASLFPDKSGVPGLMTQFANRQADTTGMMISKELTIF